MVSRQSREEIVFWMRAKWYKALRRIFFSKEAVEEEVPNKVTESSPHPTRRVEIPHTPPQVSTTSYFVYFENESYKEYTIRKQIGGRSRYVRLFFEVDFTEGSHSELQILYAAEDKHAWEKPYREGTEFFYTHFKQQRTGTLTVILDKIVWMAVDTTDQLVRFAAADACCKALNFSIDGLSINMSNGTILFPKE